MCSCISPMAPCILFFKASYLWNFFMAGSFYSQSFWHKSAERKSPKKYFFVLISELGLEPWLSSNKPTLQILLFSVPSSHLVGEKTQLQPVRVPDNLLCTGSAKYFFLILKKLLIIFLNFFFYLKVQSFPIIMENNFIQMTSPTGHAVAYTIGPIFKHIIECISPTTSRMLSFKASIASGLSA